MPDVRKTTREARLGAALRENLKRRKAQIKGRAGQPASGPDADHMDEPAGDHQEGNAAKNKANRSG